jgi:hypothetical protein
LFIPNFIRRKPMLISRDPLRDALALVSKANGSGSTLPILACVDLQAETDGLILTTNNLEMVIRTRISGRRRPPFRRLCLLPFWPALSRPATKTHSTWISTKPA